MGLENNNKAVYLSIGDGKITKRVKQQTEKSTQRITKEGKVIFEEIYDAVSGVIIDIKTTEHEQWGKFWNIYLKDGDDVFCLQTNYSGRYASAFLKTLPNINLAEAVKIIPFMKMEDGEKKVGLFVTQNGEPLKHFWNKNNPGDLPLMEKIKVKDKKTGKVKDEWSDFEMMKFLEEYVNKNIIPKLNKVNHKPAEPVSISADEESDDLPF